MEDKIMRIFEDKLEGLKELEFYGKSNETENINMILEYWREFVVKGIGEKEKLLRDMLRDKDGTLIEAESNLSLLKSQLERLEHQNVEIDNKLKLQEVLLEKERAILEGSIKGTYEEKLKNKEIEYMGLLIDMEKIKKEKEHLEFIVNEKLEELQKKDTESEKNKQKAEVLISENENQIKELKQTKEDLEKTIDMISRSRMNMWVKDAKEGVVRQEIRQEQHVEDPEIAKKAEAEIQLKIDTFKENIKELEAENNKLKDELELQQKEAEENVINNENRMKEEIEKRMIAAQADQKKELMVALRQREKIFSLSLSNLSRGFVHKMRNVIGIVSGANQMCQSEVESIKTDPKAFIKNLKNNEFEKVDELIENFNEINHHLDEASKGADEFLKISSVPEVNIQKESLNTIVNEVSLELDKLCRDAKIKVEINVDEDIPDLYISKKHIKEALNQVIMNSVESIKDGGMIKISTKLQKDGENVQTVISDNGIGVTEIRLSKIFQIFCTSKKDRRGVGLPTARRYIENHLGSIEFKSEKDKGTEVIINLPVINDFRGGE